MLCVHPKETPVAFIAIRHTMTVSNFYYYYEKCLSIYFSKVTSLALAVICVVIVKTSPTVTRAYANLLVSLLVSTRTSFNRFLFRDRYFPRHSHVASGKATPSTDCLVFHRSIHPMDIRSGISPSTNVHLSSRTPSRFYSYTTSGLYGEFTC